MSEEASTPPADTQAPPPQSGDTATGQASEPVTPPVAEPTPPPEEAAPDPEPESLSQSETETGKPNAPTTPSVGTDTPPPQSESGASNGAQQAGGEETPAPEQVSENLTGKQAEVSEAASESTPEPQAQPEPAQSSSHAPQATQADTTPSQSPPSKGGEVKSSPIIGELLVKARAKIQDRRKKKLEKIMTKLSETGKISNNEVQKLLRISDATATRYLDILEKGGRIRQEGKTGKHVVYVRV